MNCCKDPDPQYYPGMNEKGWKCLSCNKSIGFNPDLDRSHILEKIESIMQFLQMADMAYFSNSSEGEYISIQVKEACKKRKEYDQYTIILEIFNIIQPRHAKFYKTRTLEDEELENRRNRRNLNKLFSNITAEDKLY